MSTIILRNNKVYLRKINLDDAEFIHKYLTEEISYAVGWNKPKSVIETQNKIKEISKDKSRMQFIITDSESKEPLGSISLNNINKKNNYSGLGGWIRKNKQGQGYFKESVNLLLQYAFKELEFNRVQIFINVVNGRSKEFFEKVGFKKEGLLKKRSKFNGKYYDQYIYALLKDQFK